MKYDSVKKCLYETIKNMKCTINSVHDEFDYIDFNMFPCCYSVHEKFVEYFIRKHLSYQYKFMIRDLRTEAFLFHELWQPVEGELKKFVYICYKKIQNIYCPALKLIRYLRQLSDIQYMYEHNIMPFVYLPIDRFYLIKIVKYLNSLKYRTIFINNSIPYNKTNEDISIICDGETLFYIQLSRQSQPSFDKPAVSKCKIFQLFLRAYCWFKESNKRISKIKIYNPLFGLEYNFEIDTETYRQLDEIFTMTGFSVKSNIHIGYSFYTSNYY